MIKVCLSFLLLISYSLGAFVDYKSEPIQPIKIPTDLNEKKVFLGKKLFFDKRLSKDESISCLSCHNVDFGGTDNLDVSIGVDGQKGLINSPTILNSSLNYSQFWDGRATTLAEQVSGPIHNPIEMASNWDLIISRLSKINSYEELFDEVYGGEITSENIIDAIVEYEKSLVTPSRFDEYLLGNENILTQDEIDGYELFKSYGCASCHQGKNIGGNMYEKLGVYKPYPHDDNPNHFGRYNVTGEEESKHEFKIPTLRNILLTSPYFHDGEVKTLDKAIKVMGEYQLGKIIDDEDVKKIKAFFKSLTSKDLEKRYDLNDF